MSHLYSLAYLTCGPLPPPEVISIAAKLGYDAVGLRILAGTPGGEASPLEADAALRRATIARARETGIQIYDIELVRIDTQFEIGRLSGFLETCGELGAKAMLVVGDDPDESRLTASFAALCEAARPYAITADLEFMPWTVVRDANTALRVVTAADQANGGVLVDALHVARSSTTLADIAALPVARLNYAQICDAPREVPTAVADLLHTARCARLQPGEGGIDLPPLFAALPADIPISVEVPHHERIAVTGPEEWARQCLAASRRLMAQADADRG